MYRELNLTDLRLLKESLSKYIADTNNGIYHDVDFNPGYKTLKAIPNMNFLERIQYVSLRFNMKGNGSGAVLIDLKNQIHYKECLQEDFLTAMKLLLR